MATLDPVTKALTDAYRRDPKRQQEVETMYRIMDTSMPFCSTRFQSVAKKGSLVEVINEVHGEVVPYDGYAVSTPDGIRGTKQTFPIDEVAKFDVRVFDVDQIQSEDDLKRNYENQIKYRQARYLTGIRFQRILDNAFLRAEEIDLTDANQFNETGGDDIFEKLFRANESIDAQGKPRNTTSEDSFEEKH